MPHRSKLASTLLAVAIFAVPFNGTAENGTAAGAGLHAASFGLATTGGPRAARLPEPPIQSVAPRARDDLARLENRALTEIWIPDETTKARQRAASKPRTRRKARTVLEVVLNEMAGSALVGRIYAVQDAIHIASVIANRAAAAGISPQDVVSDQREFNGYDIPLRRGAEQDLVLAYEALEYVARYGPVHDATYYATPAWARNLPKGLVRKAQTKGHVYFSDPQVRSYRTAKGYVRPDPKVTFEFLQALLTYEVPVPTRRPPVHMNHRFR